MGTIKLKRKCFFAQAGLALLNVAGLGLTGAQMVQANNQGKEAEAQAEAQEEAMRQQTKALNKIAENAKNNPMASMQAAQVMQKGYSESILSRRMFATVTPGVWQNLKGLGKDIWKAWGWNKDGGWVKDGLKFGAAGAVLSYGANKWIAHDMKKEGIQMPTQQPQQQVYSSVLERKFAATDAAVDQTAKKTGGSILGKVATPVMYGLEPGMSLIGYYGQKKQLKAQQLQSGQLQPQQRTYATGSVLGSIGQGTKKIVSGLGNIITSFGLGSSEKIREIGSNWQKSGNSEWSRKLGNWMNGGGKWRPGGEVDNTRNSKIIAAAGVPVGFMAMGSIFDAGSKLGKKPFEMMDKNAYAWDKSQEQQVN